MATNTQAIKQCFPKGLDCILKHTVTPLAFLGLAGRLSVIEDLMQQAYLSRDFMDRHQSELLFCTALGEHKRDLITLVRNYRYPLSQVDAFFSGNILHAFMSAHHDALFDEYSQYIPFN